MTKQNILITVALLIIIAVLGYFGYRGYQYASIDVREYESFDAFLEAGHTSDREIVIYTEKLKEAYEEDTYGSTTPEGTFDMFITALEEDDLELASKYFVVEKQRSIEEQLRIGRENETLGNFLESLNTERNVNTPSGGRAQISIRVEGGVMNIDLINPEFSQVWKIESL